MELLLICLLISVAIVLVIKLICALLFLPFRLAFWALKGLIGLLVLAPLVILGLSVFSFAIPIAVVLLVLPVVLIVAGIAALVRLIC